MVPVLIGVLMFNSMFSSDYFIWDSFAAFLGLFCLGLFCLGIFCASGLFCPGLFCLGLFYLFTDETVSIS